MPWSETSPLDERTRFVRDARSGLYSMTELCRRFGISRKTGYKWLRRFAEDGAAGLQDRSRAPRRCPHRMDTRAAEALVRARRGHPTWGPRKLVAWLAEREPTLRLPAPSSVGALLAREGLVRRRRRRPRRHEHPGRPQAPAREANDLWTADFKGEFKMRDGRYCYPLTIADQASRYLLTVQALDTTEGGPVQGIFAGLFQEVGLPRAIQTDNGTPFASRGIHGLSRLSVWWIELGIQPVRIQPGRPEQNGAHERMHRTLKAETVIPPAGSRSAQQRRFNRFRTEYNEERPHEALGQRPPAARYRTSKRRLPQSPPWHRYPDHFQTRWVASNGAFCFPKPIFLSTALAHKPIGLEEIEPGVWSIHFHDVLLGRLQEQERKIYT